MADVRSATLDDADRIAQIAAAGFYDDPVMSWLFPDDAVRLDRLRILFGGLARDMLPDRGIVHLDRGRLRGAVARPLLRARSLGRRPRRRRRPTRGRARSRPTSWSGSVSSGRR